jgi:hypothetical protein
MPRKAKTPQAPAPLRTPRRPGPPQQQQQSARRPMPAKRVPQRHQGR